ncbi:HigA family addiction module antidote protein [Paraburkholderia sp. Tr-20389]|uniref:HigA family addiction module antitoxin n=1 Tax=Paraburkholderia sp. Tr-20389 TaxID=2703903 RepID=UPI00197F6F25|nr:HigA family addiction module antitoxin [Paraburkholderia sp. Tr-20389]MBN3757876.1 HigA family addiction module antidote protein [Paraburkholderia sp. Tr-20389]
MVIKRSELNNADFSDVSTGEHMPETTPGDVLRSEFLEPLGMSAHALSLELRVPAPRINDIVRGKRAISSETALRLSRYFGNSAHFWLNLQIAYDLRIAIAESGERIEREIEPLPPSRQPKHARLAREQLKAAEDAAAATRRVAGSR